MPALSCRDHRGGASKATGMSSPSGRAVLRGAAAGLANPQKNPEKKLEFLVGTTGIEPVTPTMSR